MTTVLLQVGILNGQPQELQYALVLCAGAHVLRDLVPVILVHLQRLQEEQGLLIRPVTCLRSCSLVLESSYINMSYMGLPCPRGKLH